jgi:hypothetical protein
MLKTLGTKPKTTTVEERDSGWDQICPTLAAPCVNISALVQFRRDDPAVLLRCSSGFVMRLSKSWTAIYALQRKIKNSCKSVNMMASGNLLLTWQVLQANTPAERRMNSKYMDAVRIAMEFGAPSLFLTLTCNPRWPEIVSELAKVG